MDRRDFLKGSALIATGIGIGLDPLTLQARESESSLEFKHDGALIVSDPVLQNYAEDSIGVAFCVSDMANGYVIYADNAEFNNPVKVKCGGYRVTDMNDKVMLVRLTGLSPATRYWYRIGADRISYKGGYQMKIIGNEEPQTVYSFVTAGKDATAHFSVINDTHADMTTFGRLIDKIEQLDPSCVIWNGDACNVEETIEAQIRIFLKPDIRKKDFASQRPYIFCPGNHDSRGMANRHLERVWMFRQPEERPSRDWDLGRNFAIRMGDIAMIGLDTAEDKLDTNPAFAGLFNSEEYRKAQKTWLKDALQQPEIASAPFLVAFCHIPLACSDPHENPGDLAPADNGPGVSHGWASWQRTCRNLWGPLLDEAGCQVLISAHQHNFHFEAPEPGRCWEQIVGGGTSLENNDGHATVIDGQVVDGKLVVKSFNMATGEVEKEFSYAPRRIRRRRVRK